MKIPIYTLKLEKTGEIESDVDGSYTCHPAQITPFLFDYFKDKDREHGVVLSISGFGNILGLAIVGIGTVSKVLMHPREILKPAILLNATSIIISHNHPNGNPNPSEADLKHHENIKKACELISIKLADNIIIGSDESYYSFSHQEIIKCVEADIYAENRGWITTK